MSERRQQSNRGNSSSNNNSGSADSRRGRGRGHRGRGRGRGRGSRGGVRRRNHPNSSAYVPLGRKAAKRSDVLPVLDSTSFPESKEPEDTPMCLLCCSEIQNPIVTACGHSNHICANCFHRMSVFKAKPKTEQKKDEPVDNRRLCPFCKTHWEKVVVTSRFGTEYNDWPLDKLYYDEELDAYFSEPQLSAVLKQHRTIYCPICVKSVRDNRPAHSHSQLLPAGVHSYRTYWQLDRHLHEQHQSRLCTACWETRSVFPSEHKVYTPVTLTQHFKQGTPATGDEAPVPPHPFCQFCDMPFFTDDELFVHVSEMHRLCKFCVKRNQQRYFPDDRAYAKHLRKKHFLCEEKSCFPTRYARNQHAAFVAFDDQLDLNAHILVVHKDSLTREQLRSMRTVNVQFSVDRRRSERSQRGRHSRRGGRRPASASTSPVHSDDDVADRSASATQASLTSSSASSSSSSTSAATSSSSSMSSRLQSASALSDGDFPSLGGAGPSATTAARSGPYGRPRMDDFPSLGASTAPPPSSSARSSDKAAKKRSQAQSKATKGKARAKTSSAKTQQRQKSQSVQQQPLPPACPQHQVQTRNRELIQRVQRAMKRFAPKHWEVNFSEFRRKSAQYRHGEITAEDYYHEFHHLVPDDVQTDVLLDLISLLPDEAKRQALYRVHSQRASWTSRAPQSTLSPSNVNAAPVLKQKQAKAPVAQRKTRRATPEEPPPRANALSGVALVPLKKEEATLLPATRRKETPSDPAKQPMKRVASSSRSKTPDITETKTAKTATARMDAPPGFGANATTSQSATPLVPPGFAPALPPPGFGAAPPTEHKESPTPPSVASGWPRAQQTGRDATKPKEAPPRNSVQGSRFSPLEETWPSPAASSSDPNVDPKPARPQRKAKSSRQGRKVTNNTQNLVDVDVEEMTKTVADVDDAAVRAKLELVLQLLRVVRSTLLERHGLIRDFSPQITKFYISQDKRRQLNGKVRALRPHPSSITEFRCLDQLGLTPASVDMLVGIAGSESALGITAVRDWAVQMVGMMSSLELYLLMEWLQLVLRHFTKTAVQEAIRESSAAVQRNKQFSSSLLRAAVPAGDAGDVTGKEFGAFPTSSASTSATRKKKKRKEKKSKRVLLKFG